MTLYNGRAYRPIILLSVELNLCKNSVVIIIMMTIKYFGSQYSVIVSTLLSVTVSILYTFNSVLGSLFATTDDQMHLIVGI